MADLQFPAELPAAPDGGCSRTARPPGPAALGTTSSPTGRYRHDAGCGLVYRHLIASRLGRVERFRD
ncbi:MAG TPA: hypothetical protein VG097_17375 [Gemmata sp.]|nr:hypothetical protein [Gemmata sp.]